MSHPCLPLTSIAKTDNFYAMNTTTILIIGLFFVFGFVLVLAVFYFFFKNSPKAGQPAAAQQAEATQTPAKDLKFKWTYIALPAAILLLACILTAIYYPQLTEEVAYRFNIDGTPKSWFSRGAVTSIALIPQFILMPLAAFIALGVIKLSRTSGQLVSGFSSEKLVVFMCNLVALPQVVIGFVMLDIFSYNVSGSHLMPVWLFVIIAMALAGVILAVFIIQALKRSRQGG